MNASAKVITGKTIKSCLRAKKDGPTKKNVKIESHLNRVRWFWHEEEDEEDYIVLDVPNVRLKEEEVKRVGMTKPNRVLRPL